MQLASEYDLAIILYACIKVRSHNDYKNRGDEQSLMRFRPVIIQGYLVYEPLKRKKSPPRRGARRAGWVSQ